MTTIASDTTTQTTGVLTAEQTTIDESLTTVIGMLSGKKQTGASLRDMKLSEDVFYAGLVYDTLLKESPDAAKIFKADIKRHFDARTKRYDSQALAKSVNDVLEAAVHKGKLTQQKASTIVGQALGHAQLDTRKGTLSRTARSGGIDTFLQAYAKNGDAKEASAKKFKEAVSTLQFIAPSVARKQRKEFNKITNSLKPPATASQTTEAPSSTGITVATGTKPEETGPNELVYRPNSKNGNIEVLIPQRYAGDVTNVVFLDESGASILSLKDGKSIKDGRVSFTGDTTAAKLPTIHSMRFLFKDGTALTYLIGKGDKEYIKQYSSS